MTKEEYKSGPSLSIFLYIILLIVPIFNGAMTSHKYTGKNGWFAGKTLTDYDGLGTGYGFIFGSTNMGKYGNDTVDYNFLFVLGFLCVLAGLIVSIIYFILLNKQKIDLCKKLKLTLIILTLGIAIAFNPIYVDSVLLDFFRRINNNPSANNISARLGLSGMFYFSLIGLVIHLITYRIRFSDIQQ